MKILEPEKKKSRNIAIRWVFGALFLIMCFSAIVEFHIIAGLLFLLAAIISIPPAATKLEKKSNFRMSGKVRFFVVFIIIMFASAALPPADSTTAFNNSTDTIASPLESANDTTATSFAASTVETEVSTTPDKKGTLDIVTSPSDAIVTVDGVSQGLSPVKGLSVDEGKHVVDLYLSGYNPKTLTVDITNSDTKTISWTFTPYVSSDSTETPEVAPTNDYDSSFVKDYDIIEENDISMKALTKSLSSYTTEEIDSLPLNTRKEYRVVISPDVSKEELKSTLIQVVMDEISKNNGIDEVVVFAYDRKEDVDNAFTLGKVEWCPNGDWGSVTPEIASSNDRSSYQYVFDIKDKVGNIDASDSPTEREYEIYDYYEKCCDAAWNNIDLSDPKATIDEDLIMEEVAKKYGITKEEASEICDKVVIYKIS